MHFSEIKKINLLIRNKNYVWAMAALLSFTLVNAQTNKIDSKSQIVIPFTLNEAGYVTLVIENEDGVRVRNLIADTWFESGKNTAWWDGQDDTGRDVDAAKHGVYTIPGKLVPAGRYTVRGIVHSKINTTY